MTAIVGIYAIENTTTGRRYIGSSIDVRRRVLAHFASLRRGCHENPHLQAAWNKHGEESFLAGVVDECEAPELLLLEQELVTRHGYYNLNRTVGKPPSRRGQHNSPEHREKCRRANLGKTRGPNSEERNAKIGAAQRGRKKPESFGAHISRALTGRKATQEHREHISAALYGRTLSAAHRASLSAARRRRP